MLEHFFQPDSVAVIGASTHSGKVGYDVFKNALEASHHGQVYPINPKATEVLGQESYPSVLEVPGEIDLAVIVVPAQIVPAVMEQCGQKGIDSVIIISAGFRETGAEGAKLEQEVGAIAGQHGIRVIGPNCLGVMCPAAGLNTTFAGEMPQAGAVALMSQSGALATSILDWAALEGIGFSKFVSFGNALDLGPIDFLQAWKDDPDTRVILAYLEGVRNGPQFMATALEVSKQKPMIVMKSGGTAAGARAVSSHSGALAGSEQAYDAAFGQSGVIRAWSVEELFDYAEAFVYQPLPRGNRVGVVTNAGGPGIMVTDASERVGLKMASVSKETVERLRTKLPAASNFYNPIDVLGDADVDRYGFALETLVADPNVDAVIAVLSPQAMTDIEASAQAVAQVADKTDKPIVGCFMGGKKMSVGGRKLAEWKVPNYLYPERAVGALAAMVRRTEWLKLPPQEVKSYRVHRVKVEQILERMRSEGRLNLGEAEAREVLSAYGFAIPQGQLATTSQEAVEIAEEIGYPVVIKIASPDILHKSDMGGVRVGIESSQEVIDGFDLMMLRAERYLPDAEVWGVLVQEMVSAGREVIVGMSRDSQFGPLIMFGLGGIYVEVLKDVSFRVAPLSEYQARRMVQEIRSYPLLSGVRGEKPTDMDALIDCMLRLSQLVCDFSEIVEMDINPLKVKEPGQGAVAIDARITIESKEQ